MRHVGVVDRERRRGSQFHSVETERVDLLHGEDLFGRLRAARTLVLPRRLVPFIGREVADDVALAGSEVGGAVSFLDGRVGIGAEVHPFFTPAFFTAAFFWDGFTLVVEAEVHLSLRSSSAGGQHREHEHPTSTAGVCASTLSSIENLPHRNPSTSTLVALSIVLNKRQDIVITW